IPILRVRLNWHSKVLWLRDMKQEKIDFKVHEMCNLEEVHKDVMNKIYDSTEGPLWCVRLFSNTTKDTEENVETSRDDKSDCVHKYVVLFGWHHSLTDGTSNMVICKHFLHLLNSVLGGEVIDDNIQLGYIADHEETNELVAMQKRELKDDPESLKSKLNVIYNIGKEPSLFLKAYPPPKGVEPETLYLLYDLGRDYSKLFFDRCKTEGVTVHTAFCGIVNAAIVELMQEAGIGSDSFDIDARHAINHRPFWKNKTSDSLGCHIGGMHFVMNTPKNVRETLWTYIKEYHSSFYNKLQNGGVFESAVLDKMNFISSGINPKTMFDTPMIPGTFYQISNMGNIDKILTGLGQYVKVSDIARTSSIHHWDNIVLHLLQTFQGSLKYSMIYDATRMTKETAQIYMDRIFSILKESL
ncbi:unnamed protein product, partial [Meganyctiphanes norvegica]